MLGQPRDQVDHPALVAVAFGKLQGERANQGFPGRTQAADRELLEEAVGDGFQPAELIIIDCYHSHP